MLLRCVLTSVFVASAVAYPPHWTRWPRKDPVRPTPLTTKIYLWELKIGANIDYGEYTTMNFQYYNDQLAHGPYTKNNYDRCYDDYIRCNLANTLPHTVCGWHKFVTKSPYTWRNILKPVSDCEVHHQNCMTGYRQWRILDIGWCYMPDIYSFNVHPMHYYQANWYHPPQVPERYSYYQ